MEQVQKEQDSEKEKIFKGAIIVFYKNIENELLFLVVENSKSGNVSFVSGAEEDIDEGLLEKTAQREIMEELGLSSDQYKLIPTDVKHEFVYGANKPEREGHKASNLFYLAKLISSENEVGHTDELRNVKWMTKEEALNALTFPEMKELFEKAIDSIKS